MIPKPLDAITGADIESLVANAVKESRTLEYKEALPGTSDNEKREFLYDLTALANAAGGDLIFGVAEQRGANGQPTGLPDKVVGLGAANLGQEQLRLEQLVLSGAEPRVPGLHFKAVNNAAGDVLLLRVAKSWVGPHMVTHGGVSRFYSRHSSGKYQLDVSEIRASFAASNEATERIAKFRRERVMAVIEGETPIALKSGPKVLLHAVPAQSLAPGFQVEVSALQTTHLLKPMHASGWNNRFNFDGWLTYTDFGYMQLFRNGTVEAVDAAMIPNNSEKRIFGTPTETEVVEAAGRMLQALRVLGVDFPVALCLTLANVRGFRIASESRFFGEDSSIDRDVLFAPPALVESESQSASSALRVPLDTIWQACGFERSPNFNAAGERTI